MLDEKVKPCTGLRKSRSRSEVRAGDGARAPCEAWHDDLEHAPCRRNDVSVPISCGTGAPMMWLGLARHMDANRCEVP